MHPLYTVGMPLTPNHDADAIPLIHLSSDFIRAKEYLETIVTSTSDAICTTDTRGRIIYFSPGAESCLSGSARCSAPPMIHLKRAEASASCAFCAATAAS